MMQTIDDLFASFEGPAGLGRAIGKPTEHAAAMKRRRSVPVRYWSRLLSSAASLGIQLSEADLIQMHAEQTEPAQ